MMFAQRRVIIRLSTFSFNIWVASAFLPRHLRQPPRGYRSHGLATNIGSADDDSIDAGDKESQEFFGDLTEKLFGGRASDNPFESTLKRVGKGLYGDEELMRVLSMHEELGGLTEDKCVPIKEVLSPQRGLHDLVLEAIRDTPISETNGKKADQRQFPNFSAPLTFDVDSQIKDKIQRIRAVASDVDGTLLSSQQTLHPRTRMAVKRAIDLSTVENTRADKENIEFFFLATGKSRKGALHSLGIEIGSLIAERNIPGVYLQGLFCVDGEGNTIFEKRLSVEAITAAEALVEKAEVSVVAYDGDDLYTTDVTDLVVHLHEHYGEPLPRLLPSTGDSIRNLSDHEACMHKLLFLDEDVEKLRTIVRPQLEELAKQYDACVTQAIPTMLELLPAGCSKALGVMKVCSSLGINLETELLALGDAENDAEMLKMAAIGVAMGNGCPLAKDAADFVMDESNNDGGAGAAMELFAFGALQ